MSRIAAAGTDLACASLTPQLDTTVAGSLSITGDVSVGGALTATAAAPSWQTLTPESGFVMHYPLYCLKDRGVVYLSGAVRPASGNFGAYATPIILPATCNPAALTLVNGMSSNPNGQGYGSPCPIMINPADSYIMIATPTTGNPDVFLDGISFRAA